MESGVWRWGLGKGVWRMMTKGRSGELREEGASLLLIQGLRLMNYLTHSKDHLHLFVSVDLLLVATWRLLLPDCLLNLMISFFFVTLTLPE